MKKFFRSLRKSIISKKIVQRILLSGVACFLIVLFFSCLVILPLLKGQALGQAAAATTRLAGHFSNAQSDIEQSADFIAGNLEFNEVLDEYLKNPVEQTQNRLSLHLESLIYANSNIFYAALETGGYPVITSAFHSLRANTGLFDEPQYEQLTQSSFGTYYSPIYRTYEPSASENKLMQYQVCSLSKNYYIGTKKYTLTVFYNMDSVLREARSSYPPFLDDYGVISNSGAYIYPSGGSGMFSAISGGILTALQTHELETVPGGYYFSAPTDNYSWQAIAFVSGSTLNASFFSIFLIIAAFFLLSSFTTVFFIMPYLLKRMKPLKELSNTMAAYSIGGNPVYSTVHTDDEINEMSRIFNSMVKSNDEYVHELIQNEKVRQQMEYSLLISQIDPHFIYNTMNIITALARQKKYREVVAVNQALEKMLRDRLRVHNIEIYDTVAHELDIIKQYILIMKYRYGSSVDVVYEVSPAVMRENIPKNLIQPLVENAFYHGLTNEDGIVAGVITISVLNREDALAIEVADNGAGISPEKLQQLRSLVFSHDQERGRHIGLENVISRINYLYRTEECIQFESVSGKGTLVRLLLKRGNADGEPSPQSFD